MPDDRLLDGIRVSGELVADRRPDEVGAIGVEALMHQQIDMAKVDESDVDCDFLSLARLVSQSVVFLRLWPVLKYHPNKGNVDDKLADCKKKIRKNGQKSELRFTNQLTAWSRGRYSIQLLRQSNLGRSCRCRRQSSEHPLESVGPFSFLIPV